MKKSIIMLLAVLPLMLFLASCDSHKVDKTKLKMEVESVQGQLPIDCGSMGLLTGVTYKDDVVTFTYSANEDIIDVDGLSKDSNMVKQNFQCLATLDNSIQQMLKEIGNAQGSLCIKYKGKESGKVAKVNISNADLSNMDKFLLSREEAGEMFVNNTLKIERNKMPMDLGNGIMLDKSFWEGKTLVYHASLDGSVYPPNALSEADVAGMKQGIAEGLGKERASKTFIETLAVLGRNLCYRYQVEGTDNCVDVVFTPKDLKKLLGLRPTASDK